MESINNLETKVDNTFAGREESIDIKNGSKPFVRFADGKASQKPVVRSVYEPIPDDASFASPLYYLSDRELRQQQELENPYKVKPENCIGKALQDTAERAERDYYPLYVESDAEAHLDTQVDWIGQFVREELHIPPRQCTWYFSGGKSIHLHIPQFARRSDLEDLRDRAKEFDGELDPKIYECKRQFRLPGVEHSKNGLPKVEIDPEWSHTRIFREAAQADVSPPDTVAELYKDIYGDDVLTSPERYVWQPESESDDTVDPGVNDWECYRSNRTVAHRKWKSHYSEPVSPYANAGNGNRSLLVAKVRGGAFCEKRETYYEGDSNEVPDERGQTFVPCEILAFWGCDRSFTLETRALRPVRLSKLDYPKFASLGIEEGDIFVLIGTRSRSSRVFKPDTFESKTVAGSQSFIEGIEALEAFDYDTGESRNNDTGSFEDYNGEERDTEAYHLQRKVERDGIETLSHGDRLLVMLRLLAVRGIEGTRDWFKREYGDDYDPELTNQHIRTACQKYDDTPDYEPRNVSRTQI